MFPIPTRKRRFTEQVVPCTTGEVTSQIHSTTSLARRNLSSSTLSSNPVTNPFDDANYPIPDFENVYNLMRHPQRGLTLAARRWRILTYSKCFVGSEAVQWIMTNLSCNREDAIMTGERLMDAGIIHHVTHSEPFSDEYYFYCFQEDDGTNVLNMKRVWHTSIPTRHAVDVAKDLLTRLALLCEEHRKHVLAERPSSPSSNSQPPASTAVNNYPTNDNNNPVADPSAPRMSDPITPTTPTISTSSPMLQRHASLPPMNQQLSPQFSAAPWAPNVGDEVDYSTLAKSERFRQYVLSAAELQRVQLVALNHHERIAFFVNIYNTLCLHAYVVYGTPNNWLRRYIFFRALSYRAAGLDLTLDDIEHGILRGNKRPPMLKFIQQLRPADPKCQHVITVRDGRIHFVISAGTRSDPPIRILDGDNVQEELHDAAVEFLSVTVKVDVEKRTVTLPRIFYWYPDDFPSPVKQLMLWVARYLPAFISSNLVSLVNADAPPPAITYENFDWAKAEARFNASVIRSKRRKLERERNSTQHSNQEACADGLFTNNGVGVMAASGRGSSDGIEGLFSPAQPQMGISPIISSRPLTPIGISPLMAVHIPSTDPRSPAIDGRIVPATGNGVASAVSEPLAGPATDSSPILIVRSPSEQQCEQDNEQSAPTSSKSKEPSTGT